MPVITVSNSIHPDGSSQKPPTITPIINPKTSVLRKDSNNIKVWYVGKLELLDNQAYFDEVFGEKPTILATSIIKYQYSTSKIQELIFIRRKVKVECFSEHVQEVICWTPLSRKFIERSRRFLSDLTNKEIME